MSGKPAEPLSVESIIGYWNSKKNPDGGISFGSGEEAAALLTDALRQMWWLICQLREWRAYVVGNGLIEQSLTPDAEGEVLLHYCDAIAEIEALPPKTRDKIIKSFGAAGEVMYLRYEAAGCPKGPASDLRNVIAWWREQVQANAARLNSQKGGAN